MQRLTRSIVVGATTLVATFGAYGVASAASGAATQTVPGETEKDGSNETNDSDAPLTGTDLEKAVAAALAHTGGGEVTETETGDDGAAYGVEIRTPDGGHVEVNLDGDFNVIGSGADDD